MDIPSLACDMNRINLLTDVGFAMLSKTLDSVQSTGDDLVKIMEQSVKPNLGQNIDIRV